MTRRKERKHRETSLNDMLEDMRGPTKWNNGTCPDCLESTESPYERSCDWCGHDFTEDN
jgi:hypothetical protein